MTERTTFTAAERRLLTALNDAYRAGLILSPIRAQETVHHDGGTACLDFAIPAQRIGVEIDGVLFHSTVGQRKADADRDKALEVAGWRILRFKDEDVMSHADGVVRRIVAEVSRRIP
jgi:very-short-patch-repair endonuclease